jgi:uncharacterized spore protein YtfJ
MPEIPAKEILDALMKNLKEIISTKSIVGEPIQVGQTTVLPVMKVTLGFAAGGPGEMIKNAGGGGGGVSITPVGFLIVEDGRAMMITPQSSRWDWVIESIPDLVEKLVKIRKDYKEKKDPKADSAEDSQKTV